MNLSTLEEYSLRCAVQLARLSDDEHLSASLIADKVGLSFEYVTKIMFLFRKHNLIESVRGLNGGYKLSYPAASITMKQVLDTLPCNSKKPNDDFCDRYQGKLCECIHIKECSMRPVFNYITGFFDEITSRISLEDLISPEEKVQRKIDWLALKTKKLLKSTFGAVASR